LQGWSARRQVRRLRQAGAAEHGVSAEDLFEVIGVSTGQSWMSDNLIDVQYDLLLKDVGLLRGELGSLPAADLNDEVEQAILQARSLLGSDSANK
jgi:putative dehydrogenase